MSKNLSPDSNIEADFDLTPYSIEDQTGKSTFRLDAGDPFPRLPLPSGVATRYTGEIEIPRPLPSLDLSTSSTILEEEIRSAKLDLTTSHDLSQPDTADLLKSRCAIEELENKLDKYTISDPCEAAKKEAERLFREASAFWTKDNVDPAENFLPNPGLTVNIAPGLATFDNLVPLTFDDSLIVKQERLRIARQRRHFDKLRQAELAKVKPEPEPDLLEFFDPKQHVFQSLFLPQQNLNNSKLLATKLPSISPSDFLSTNYLQDQADRWSSLI